MCNGSMSWLPLLGNTSAKGCGGTFLLTLLETLLTSSSVDAFYASLYFVEAQQKSLAKKSTFSVF